MAETLVGSGEPGPIRGPNTRLIDDGAMLGFMAWSDRANLVDWIPDNTISRDYLIAICCRADGLGNEEVRQRMRGLHPEDSLGVLALQLKFLEDRKGFFFDAPGVPTPVAARSFGMAIAAGIIARPQPMGRLRDVSGPPDMLDTEALEATLSRRLHPGLPTVFRRVDRRLFWRLELEELYKGGHSVISRYIDLDDKTAGFG